jgi:hypothetical protein
MPRRGFPDKPQIPNEEHELMKKLAMTLALALVAGAALTEAGSMTGTAPENEKGARISDQTMEGEVISADATGKVLTIKADSGDNKTLSVDGKALTALKSVKAGDRVTVKVTNNSVTEIKTKTATQPPEREPMN